MISTFKQLLGRINADQARSDRIGKTRRPFEVNSPKEPCEPLPGQRDIFAHYDLFLGREQGFGLDLIGGDIEKGSITWVIPDFTKSSGGHINMVRMMKMLQALGFTKQTVAILQPHRWSNVQDAQTEFDKAFDCEAINLTLGGESMRPCEFTIATSWNTAYWVSKYKDTVHRCYFVQDFEPAFYAVGDEYYLAENSYRLGLTGITAGSWLAEKLKREYGMRTLGLSFSYDKERYKPKPKTLSSKLRIFFYTRPVTPRRCFDIGLLTLNKVCKELPNCTVVMAGWDVADHYIPFSHTNAGIVELDDLPELYSQCDVALVLSGTNLSLLPMELAACNCPIIMNDDPQARWLFDDSEVVYANLDVDSLANAIIDLLNNPGKAKLMADKAMAAAQKSSWDDQGRAMANFLEEMQG